MRFNGDEPDDDDSLLEWVDTPTATERRVLVHGISGFLDAGNGVRLAADHLINSTESKLLASFDIDLLFDYRSRRPHMAYMTDHFESVDMPTLNLVECIDERGTPFLLLTGIEPDMGWMTVIDSVVELVEDYDVDLTVGLQAVPFPAPHTRPTPVTAHATEPELIAGRIPWVGDMEIPGSLSALLELQLGREGHPAMGFAAHVPHYLANIDHPRSALTLLTELMAATGLVIPLDSLRQAADEADRDLDEQISGNAENREVVQALERSFDEMLAARGGAEHVASGEDIAEQVERFLAEMDARGRDQES